jgi:hypothetical protein
MNVTIAVNIPAQTIGASPGTLGAGKGIGAATAPERQFPGFLMEAQIKENSAAGPPASALDHALDQPRAQTVRAGDADNADDANDPQPSSPALLNQQALAVGDSGSAEDRTLSAPRQITATGSALSKPQEKSEEKSQEKLKMGHAPEMAVAAGGAALAQIPVSPSIESKPVASLPPAPISAAPILAAPPKMPLAAGSEQLEQPVVLKNDDLAGGAAGGLVGGVVQGEQHSPEQPQPTLASTTSTAVQAAGAESDSTAAKDGTSSDSSKTAAGSGPTEASSVPGDSASTSAQRAAAQSVSAVPPSSPVHEAAPAEAAPAAALSHDPLSLAPGQSPPNVSAPPPPDATLHAGTTGRAGTSASAPASADPHALLDSGGAAARNAVWQLSPNRVEAGFTNAQNSWTSVVAQRQDGHLTAALESGSLTGKDTLQSLLPQLNSHLADRQVQVNQIGVSVRQQFSPGGGSGGGSGGETSDTGYGQGQQHSGSQPQHGMQAPHPALISEVGISEVSGGAGPASSALMPGRMISFRA